MKKNLLCLSLVFISFAGFSQKELKLQRSQKQYVSEFNSKKAHLDAAGSQALFVENMKTDDDLKQIITYLGTLDDKITQLDYDLNTKSLSVFYGNDIQLLDIMQGLKELGYPAQYTTADGKKAIVGYYGNLEIIDTNK